MWKIGLVAAACAAIVVESQFDAPGFDGWAIQEGDWRVEQGRLVHDDRHFKGGLAARPGRYMRDASLTADLRIEQRFWDQESVWAGLLLRAPDPMARGAWAGGYLAFIRARGDVELHVAGSEQLALVETGIDPCAQTVRLAIETKGSAVRVAVDGETCISVQHDGFEGGEAALVNFGNVASFDNVRLEGAPEPKPAPTAIAPNHPTPPRRAPINPLPRIGVCARRLCLLDTGEPFVPRGFNHTVLSEGPGGWHATFNVGVYDADATEQTLARMAAWGANVVRVWIWGQQNEGGFTGPITARGLNGAYMENVVDFLRRAARHGLYVVPILDETPHNAYYNSISECAADPHDFNVTGYNRQYLARGPIAAKAQAAADFVRYIQQADPGLLDAVLAWSLANEVFVNHSEGPFREREGLAGIANGRRYDMADPAARQACYDDGIRHWADALAGAIKAVDPKALVTAGMWTADAHGRAPDSGLMPDDKDPRRPPRPSVLGAPNCRLDLLDIHVYPWDGAAKIRPAAHEAEAVAAAGTPVIVGEYGVFKNKSIAEARIMMRKMLEQAYALGYCGDLHWVWDLTMIKGQTWSSVEHELGAYLMALPVRP